MTAFTKGVFYDGNLTTPVEVEGSGDVTVDEITTAAVVIRKYAVLRNFYRPPQVGFTTFPDYQYGTAYFCNETVTGNSGSITFFSRKFCTLPPSRIESRLISFTYPGLSSQFVSANGAIGWSPYGVAAPKTKLVTAQVLFTYALQPNTLIDPNSLFSPVVQLSQITYQGKLVDFCGPVYVPSGQVNVGGNKTEQRWVYQGTTVPPAIGALVPYIISAEQRRYMGPIWEQAVVQLTNGAF